ncbi:hypothetical protein [Maridesulfovibrio salexigens]|uniref:Uncharacterized protein n=1 Tax=Maridesulfovibrio salexigens (strain ATCC 14822 / DSM 2638 / NCIMB 8403 / VKM B-1763) TaxID=526222 RepID=C6BWE2_MARSD|nr:hypothetical protein [Maridesulfovibrio salexigens]ACS78386.1 hypothetical protein Desal_0319 [Maridesulfovibrio salexigens DSM 2638]
MLELSKKAISTEQVEICLRVPTKESQAVMDVLRRCLQQAGYELRESSSGLNIVVSEEGISEDG